MVDTGNPLIIQSDRSILVEVTNPRYEGIRDFLNIFAELVKSPEYIHTYRITPISLWNAASTGVQANRIIEFLDKYSKYEVPQNVEADVLLNMERYGLLSLIKEGDELHLVSMDPILIEEIARQETVQPYIEARIAADRIRINPGMRGHLKQACIKIGYPVEDLAGYIDGAHLAFELLSLSRSGQSFGLRDYQTDAVEIFYAGGGPKGGSGIVVLPCGAGKTMVGMGAMEKLQCHTLILSTNIIAVKQWRAELLDKTTLDEQSIGEYTGEIKQIRPVTVTTYQILTYRKTKEDIFPHFDIFTNHNWGFIIYDEVHLLPAPVFRITAEIQSKRRLGLTATLVREDGKEDDVFSLIGPKKYDVPWKDLERRKWIATAECHEIRVSMPVDERYLYATSHRRAQFRICMENSRKFDIVKVLLALHRGDQILVIGQYLNQLRHIAEEIGAPIITGATKTAERQELYSGFKSGSIKVLVVSKVANFAIDLPDANVAIQVSGTFGSRQEEAQRLGRILRPKQNGTTAYFYTVISRNTRDQDFSQHRQLFLTEQGYKYMIHDESEFL